MRKGAVNDRLPLPGGGIGCPNIRACDVRLELSHLKRAFADLQVEMDRCTKMLMDDDDDGG